MRYITRIETTRSKAWRVLFVRGLSRGIQVYFNDSHYPGGRDDALKDAKAFRDQVVALHEPQKTVPNAKTRGNLKYKEKPAELVGLTLHQDTRKYRNNYLWRATVVLDGVQVKRNWSVMKYGYQTAFRKARDYRVKLTGQPIAEEAPPPPEDLVLWARVRGVSLR
ncbi:MAG: hypothetical protein AB7E55_32560 [Pigmentiphaga sp.]